MSTPESLEVLVQKILVDQATMSEKLTGALRRLDDQSKLTQSVNQLAMSVEVLANSLKSTNEKVDTLTKDMEVIKNRPAKREDTVVTLIITAVVSAFVGYILSNMGLK